MLTPVHNNGPEVPILLVCYARPQNLKLISDRIKIDNRELFIFIDKADQQNILGNAEVIRVARELESHPNVRVYCSSVHLGVAHGVPQAINWAFEYCEEAIVLEDDCLPTEEFFIFVELNRDKLGDEIKLVSGTSPWVSASKEQLKKTTTSSHPLIWGWYTNKNSWYELSRLLNQELTKRRYFAAIVKAPQKFLVINYFLAAKIRTDKGILQAWDSKVALEMLVSGFMGIIPSADLVENIGKDAMASHESSNSRIFSLTSAQEKEISANATFDSSEISRNLTNRAIQRNIYGLKKRHFLSPIKALINLR